MVEGAHSLGGLGRSFLVDEGVELVVVEILEFELALGDFGTWVAGACHLWRQPYLGELPTLRPRRTKTVLFQAVLRSMRLFLVYCFTYGGA